MAAEFALVLERAVNRDDEAFAELWRAYQPPLVRYLRTVDAPSAEDVASETWIAVARGLRSFEGDEPAFRAWLFTIARRRVIDLRRATRRRPSTASSDVPDAGTADAADVAGEHMATAVALRLIAKLPPDQAEVVVLRAVAGLDVGHVAAIVGKRPGTVRVLAYRGLHKLRELVEPQL